MITVCPKLIQHNDYYPFYLKFKFSVTGPEHPFTYNGKELEDAFGLHWYYYGARFYDPAVARWWAVDPADEFHTPFGYVGNNPINFTDFMGMMSNCPDCYDGGTLGEITVTAPRIYDSNFQNIGGDWGAWWFAFTHDFMSAFTGYNMYNYYNINGTYYAEHKIWAKYGKPITGTAPVPGRIGGGKMVKGIGTVAQTRTKYLAKFYPSNGGALGKWKTEYLIPGTRIDRFGRITGKYFSPAGTPMSMRALPPNANKSMYNVYEVLKPFPVQSSTIAPAYGELGLGTQFRTPVNAKVLLERGIIKSVQ